MQHPLHDILAPIRKRQQAGAVLQSVACGLLAGSAIALALAALRLWLPVSVVAGLAAVAVLIGGALGGWQAIERKVDLHAAAAAVDAHYRLQDRTITALAFLQQPARSPLEEMQVAEALGQLRQVDPRQVVPSRLPKALPAAALLIALAATAVALPLPSPPPECKAESARAAESKLAKPDTPLKKPLGAKPPAPKPSSDPAAAERLRAEVRWQPAAGGAAQPRAANAPAGPAIRELASQVAAAAGTSDAAQGAKPQAAGVALESQPLPLQHRVVVRRYFQSIRPQE